MPQYTQDPNSPFAAGGAMAVKQPDATPPATTPAQPPVPSAGRQQQLYRDDMRGRRAANGGGLGWLDRMNAGAPTPTRQQWAQQQPWAQQAQPQPPQQTQPEPAQPTPPPPTTQPVQPPPQQSIQSVQPPPQQSIQSVQPPPQNTLGTNQDPRLRMAQERIAQTGYVPTNQNPTAPPQNNRQVYEQMYSSIMSNPKMSAQERQRAMMQLNQRLRQGMGGPQVHLSPPPQPQQQPQFATAPWDTGPLQGGARTHVMPPNWNQNWNQSPYEKFNNRGRPIASRANLSGNQMPTARQKMWGSMRGEPGQNAPGLMNRRY